MKILIIKTFPVEIKIENITYNHQEIGLATALRKNGHICDVMCVSEDGMYHEHQITMDGQNIKLYCVCSLKILKNGILKNVDTIFNQYDILQPCEYNQIFTWHIARKYPNKTVIYHGPYYSSFNKRYNLMAKVFDLFFVNTYRKLNTCFITKSNLAANYLNKKRLTNTYPIGVGLGMSFLTNNNHPQHLAEIDKIISIEGIKLLYIGTIEERRNSLFLLDILSELHLNNKKAYLILVGKSKSEKYNNIFWDKVKRQNLSNYIIHINSIQQKDIAQVYSCADIFLLPTRYDIFGMVLLEAMFFKTIVITTVNGGSNMMIENGINGYIIKDFDSKEWSNTIISSIENDNAQKIKENAHATIVKSFTWECLAKKFINIYLQKIKESLS